MICNGCGNPHAYAWCRHEDGGESCNKCSVASMGGTPDVYFKGSYVDEHLSSEAFPGPKLITSRREKAMWLKRCNLRENGDRKGGTNNFDKISHSHAMESLNKRRP